MVYGMLASVKIQEKVNIGCFKSYFIKSNKQPIIQVEIKSAKLHWLEYQLQDEQTSAGRELKKNLGKSL